MVFGGEEAGDLDAPGHALVALQQFFEVAFQELHPSDWLLGAFPLHAALPGLPWKEDETKTKKTYQDMIRRRAKLKKKKKKELNDSSTSVLLKFWETELLN